MIIYDLTSPSGKHYIGQTVQGLPKRWRQHCDDALRRPSKLGSALKKHGTEGWKRTVICECDSHEQLNEMETFLISEFGDYNILPGGDCGPVSASTRAKLSVSRRSRVHTPESNERRSATLKNREFTDEHRAKLSAAGRGRKLSPESIAKMKATKARSL